MNKDLMVSRDRVKSRFNQLVGKSRYLVTTAAVTAATAFPAFAAEADAGFDPSTALASSFQTMATSILSTITATLPVVMSVMSAYICINYGIKFFKHFVK